MPMVIGSHSARREMSMFHVLQVEAYVTVAMHTLCVTPSNAVSSCAVCSVWSAPRVYASAIGLARDARLHRQVRSNTWALVERRYGSLRKAR